MHLTAILQATAVSKVYDRDAQQRILKHIDLELAQGEFVAVMGPSGSGKSTLLYTISGMDRMTSGSVKVGGQELAELSEQELSALRLNKMGFIFQHIHLLKNLGLFDNIIVPSYLAGKSSRKAINQRAKELMELTGIADLADHDITQASGGQLQRVGICRALINQPDILFGDEPTGALNSQFAVEIMELLGSINRSGTTMLLVTHDVKVAARADRVLYMLDGRLVAEKQLGKYNPDGVVSELKDREERLAVWLKVMGL